jgi:hypothetical protein
MTGSNSGEGSSSTQLELGPKFFNDFSRACMRVRARGCPFGVCAKRMKDSAARVCRGLCRSRVLEEMRRRKGTSTAEHLKIVLSVIDDWAPFQLNDN